MVFDLDGIQLPRVDRFEVSYKLLVGNKRHDAVLWSRHESTGCAHQNVASVLRDV